MESANYLISIFRLISRGLAVGVGCAREGPRCGVGQCWTSSPHILCSPWVQRKWPGPAAGGESQLRSWERGPRLAASCASTCAVHPGQCAGLSSLVTIIKMPPRNSEGRSQCQTLQTKLHCTILFELYLRIFYKGNHKKPKNQRKLFLYYHKIKIIIIHFCNALQSSSLNYRVSHIIGPTLFLLFSPLLEHVQRNFS